jgi:hypothetical protein
MDHRTRAGAPGARDVRHCLGSTVAAELEGRDPADEEAAMGRPQIVVGIDGSATARQAMYWAALECERRGAELVLAHAGDAEAGDAVDARSAAYVPAG